MVSPMMQQWHDCKAQAKDALLLFRLGDFYEAFYDDAKVISKEIHLTLTHRQQIPMCGVPAHALENYLDKLLAKGFRIAIAEQMEDPKLVKGLVKRQITRIVSPGAIINSTLLSEKTNNYFVSLSQIGSVFGLALIDLTTCEFRVLEVETIQEVRDEVFRLHPSEILVSEKFKGDKDFGCIVNTGHFDPTIALDALLSHFRVQTLDCFGLKDKMAAIVAAGALLLYLKDDLRFDLNPIQQIQLETLKDFMSLDRTTLQNLEIKALLTHLDKTRTSMGGRLLARWVKQPLLSVSAIEKRQDAIDELLKKPDLLLQIKDHLDQVRDIERLSIKIATKQALLRDLLALALSLDAILLLKGIPLESPLWQEDHSRLYDLSPLSQKVQKALDGNAFKPGYHAPLDELRSISHDSKLWIASYQNKLKEESGIKTLKVGYTKAFGYYIEVSKGQSDKAPSYFQRRQTLVSSERFVTEELKTFEHKVLTAEERIKGIEAELFDALCQEITSFGAQLKSIAEGVARIDALFALAFSAMEYGYVRPMVDTSNTLQITKGRHPLIERALPQGAFISNDTLLNSEQQLYLITGPNMAGKSTYIRQVALIAILAQIGSFVPAASAHIGIIDKVFSRIGASDDLARGQSTFMVEMSETANILHNATSQSLVILDEIGRGTSTYDGISIAWAVAEYLLGKKPKTLFATHYWELTQMEGKLPGCINYKVAIKETESGIAFLHKIVPGATDKSYGIHVAKLAGLPHKAIKKAEEILQSLEKENRKTPKPETQLSLFVSPHQHIIDALKKLDLNQMTPIDAHRYLAKLTDSLYS